MADDPPKDAPAARIDIAEDREVRYWCERLGVTPERLRALVDKVGPIVDDVCVELGRKAPEA